MRYRQLRIEVHDSAHHEAEALLVYFGLFVFYGKLLPRSVPGATPHHPYGISPAVLTGRTCGSRASSFGGYVASHDRTFEPRYPKNVWGFMILFKFLLVITPLVIASSSYPSIHHIT